MKGIIKLDKLTAIVEKLTPFITKTVITFSPEYIRTRNLTPDRTVFVEAEAPKGVYQSASPPPNTVGVDLTELQDALKSLQIQDTDTAHLELSSDSLTLSTPSITYEQQLKEQGPLRPDIDIPSFDHTAQIIVDTHELRGALTTAADIADRITITADPEMTVLDVRAQSGSQSVSITLDSPTRLEADETVHTTYPASRLASLVELIDTDRLSFSFSERTMATITGGFLDGARLKYLLVPSKQRKSTASPQRGSHSQSQQSTLSHILQTDTAHHADTNATSSLDTSVSSLTSRTQTDQSKEPQAPASTPPADLDKSTDS